MCINCQQAEIYCLRHVSISCITILDVTAVLDYVRLGSDITQPRIDMRTHLYIGFGHRGGIR
jgi:hypothetical protein